MPKIDKDKALREAIRRYEDEVSLLNEEYERYEFDLKFARNFEECQWDYKIRSQREADKAIKPCLVVNKLAEKVRTMLGEFEELNPGVTINPVDSNADPIISDILGGLVKHIEANSKAKVAYKTSHSNTLHMGIGGWKIELVPDKIQPEVSNIVIKGIADPLRLRFDPFAQEYDKSDARYVFYVTEISKKMFEAKYPDIDTSGWSSYNSNLWMKSDSVRICEYWWKETEKVNLVLVLRNGEQLYVYEDTLQPTDQILDEKKIRGQRDKIYYGKMVHDQFIEGPFDDYPIDRFPFVFQGGDYSFIDGLPRYYSMVHFAKEVQQLYNYFVSTAVEQVLLQPKAPYLVDFKSIEAYKEHWDESNRLTYPYLPFDSAEGVTPPTRLAGPELGTGIANLLELTNRDIMSSMGVYESSLGQSGPEISGLAIGRKQRQGSMANHTYMDNFEASLAYSAQIIVDLIPYVYDTERVVRILGPDSRQKIVMINTTLQTAMANNMSPETHVQSPTGLINDLTSAGKYDVVVDIGPSHATQRQENLDMMIELLKTIPNKADMLAPLLIKYIDTPAAQEISKAFEEQAQNQQLDPAVATAQAEVQRKQQADQLNFQIQQQKLMLEQEKQKFEEFKEAYKLELEELKRVTDLLKAGVAPGQEIQAEQALGAPNPGLAVSPPQFQQTPAAPGPIPPPQMPPGPLPPYGPTGQ